MTEGERWTRERLDELRAARFAPSAWRSFLSASFERARVRRRAHRRAHLQTLSLGAIGLFAWALAATAGWPVLALFGALWWVLVVLMLDWHLGMLERPDGRPLTGLGAANTITVARAAIIPVFAALDRSGLLVALVAFAAMDVADGLLARRREEETRLGAWLDGSIDSVAAALLVLAAEQLDVVPLWVAMLVLARIAMPWIVLSAVYFGSPRSLPARLSVRAPGVLARLPAGAALVGIAIALAGIGAGVFVMAIGVVGSLISFAFVVGEQVELPTAGEASRSAPG